MKKIILLFILLTNFSYSQNDTIPDFGLENEDFYNTRWVTIGGNFDPFNSLAGINISNGFDEEPLIHFEDFQDNFIFKLEGQTDFNNDYSFNSQIGILFPIKFISNARVGYTFKELKEESIRFSDVFLQMRSGYFGNTSFILKTGFQNLNKKNNYGFDLGVQQHFKKMYSGLLAGYYNDYFNFNGYLQYELYGNSLNLFSLRLEYSRIDKYDFLNIGLHWSFVRK